MAKAQNGWRELSAIRGDRPGAVANSPSLGLDQDLAANRGSSRQRRRLWSGAVEWGTQ